MDPNFSLVMGWVGLGRSGGALGWAAWIKENGPTDNSEVNDVLAYVSKPATLVKDGSHRQFSPVQFSSVTRM